VDIRIDRKEILMVLDKLLCAFDSMKSASIVSISKVEKSCDWELQVKWVVGSGEKLS
jgi:hypothetical protein